MIYNTTTPDTLGKLKACIFYACNKEQPEHAQLDHIKLNKVLWYSDTASYMESGKSITGGRYVRKPHGPVAKYMIPATQELMAQGILTSGKRYDADRGMWVDTYEVIGESAIADEDDDVTPLPQLSNKEKEYLDHAFKGACLATDSNTISERTHGEIWELATNGEDIPLYAMYAESKGKIKQSHIDAAFGK